MKSGSIFFLILFAFGIRNADARDYDLYRADNPKGAYCAVIAGACSADPEMENGFFQNPAVLTTGNRDWSYDADYNGKVNFEPGANAPSSSSKNVVLGGIGRSGERWAAAFAFILKHEEVDSNVNVVDDVNNAQGYPLTAKSTQVDIMFPVAYRLTPDFSVGAGIAGTLNWNSLVGGDGSKADFTQDSTPIDLTYRLGAYYHERKSNWAYGTWFKSATSRYSHVSFDTVTNSTSLNYAEDIVLHDPWTLAVGTRWTPWADGRAVLFDLKAIGTTSDGYLLSYDTFTASIAGGSGQEKGHYMVYEPRLGIQNPIEWGGTRKSSVLLGTYYEAARRTAASGRMHYTGGLSYEAISGYEFMVGADLGRNFAEFYVTFR